MKTYICIPREEGPYEVDVYPIDTEAETAEAVAAMKKAGIDRTKIFVGAGDDAPDSYHNGQYFTA